jgi:hypothetical protein
MNPNCPICRGIGWVCENHPDKPWAEDIGCRCGAGMPCKCNGGDEEADINNPPDTSAVIGNRALH